MKKDKRSEAAMVCPVNMPTTLHISESDYSKIKSKRIGDKCEFTVKGKVTSLHQGWGDKKEVMADIEVESIKPAYDSKRLV